MQVLFNIYINAIHSFGSILACLGGVPIVNYSVTAISYVSHVDLLQRSFKEHIANQFMLKLCKFSYHNRGVFSSVENKRLVQQW